MAPVLKHLEDDARHQIGRSAHSDNSNRRYVRTCRSSERCVPRSVRSEGGYQPSAEPVRRNLIRAGFTGEAGPCGDGSA